MTKLQKLLFILYGYYLAQQNRKIVDEQPRAWPFGPVFPAVHKNIDYTSVREKNDAIFSHINNDVELVSAIEKVIDRYARYSASELSNWSHMKGSPWEKTKQEPGFKWNASISDSYIKDYFSNKKII